MATFLGALVVVFGSAPFEEQFRAGDLMEALRLTLVLVPALLAVGARRHHLAWGLFLVIPALVGKWVNHFRPDLAPAWVFLVPSLLFVLFLIAHLLRFILHAPRIDSEVLCAGVATYLMLGLLWGVAYILVARLTPGAFSFTAGPVASQVMQGSTAIYFSFITLCTVGYGDIVPVSGAARMLAMMEAMAGTFYMAVLVARLVSLHTAHAQSRQE
jgi:hypothetical protein